MKKIILSIVLTLPIFAHAQSVTIRIIANDGATQTTNTVNVPAIHVQGLLSSWADDSRSKTNGSPPAAALTFGQYVVQELTDKSSEWNGRGGLEAVKAFAVTQGHPELTNSIPPRLAQIWSTLTPTQKTNAIAYLNQIGP